MSKNKHPSSFRDPNGFIFTSQGTIYRQINQSYRQDYDHLFSSGLYQNLVEQQLLIPHSEIKLRQALTENAYKVIKPEPVPFISYPYEWSFSQLKDAALTTLTIQKLALRFGMALKDASAFNIQFVRGKPILIDSLSFRLHREGQPWIAYQQFCQHFLAPLTLISSRHAWLNQLGKTFLDGIPLELASALLPIRTWLRPSLFSHLNFQAWCQKRFASQNTCQNRYRVSQPELQALADNLESTIKQLQWHPPANEWRDYYQSTYYSATALKHKKEVVNRFLSRIKPKTVWDLGANLGAFSQIAASRGADTIAIDHDPVTVESHYLDCKHRGETRILPLVINITNPSPSLGWANQERASLLDRGPAEMVLALAIVHHLVLTDKIPLIRIASFCRQIGQALIIEFAAPEDSQVRQMIATKPYPPDYNQANFEKAFRAYFQLIDKVKIKGSKRWIYVMTKLCARRKIRQTLI